MDRYWKSVQVSTYKRMLLKVQYIFMIQDQGYNKSTSGLWESYFNPNSRLVLVFRWIWFQLFKIWIPVTIWILHFQVTKVDEQLEIKAYYAGHVLGAAMFQIRVGSQSVVYTGDYNMTPDRHLVLITDPNSAIPMCGTKSYDTLCLFCIHVFATCVFGIWVFFSCCKKVRFFPCDHILSWYNENNTLQYLKNYLSNQI